MTYPHALRYITQPTSPQDEIIELSSVAPELTKSDLAPLAICFSDDKIGAAAAAMLEAVLFRAGVPTLRWIDDPALPPKERFFHRGNPLSPPLLAKIAGEIQQKERALRPSKAACLATHDRAATVLAEYAKSCGVRILLLQSDPDVAPARAFGALFPHLSGITLISQNRKVPAGAALPFTREIISLPCGPVMFRRISDACVTSGSRLSLTQGTKCRIAEETPGGRTVQYRTLPPCRIFSAAPSATDALSLALECVLSFDRLGITVPEQAIAQGLADVTLPYCCAVISIEPLIVADLVKSPRELARSVEDIRAGWVHFPAPRALWVEPGLRLPEDLLLAFDERIFDESTPIFPSRAATSLVVGSSAFIETVIGSPKKTEK